MSTSYQVAQLLEHRQLVPVPGTSSVVLFQPAAPALAGRLAETGSAVLTVGKVSLQFEFQKVQLQHLRFEMGVMLPSPSSAKQYFAVLRRVAQQAHAAMRAKLAPEWQKGKQLIEAELAKLQLKQQHGLLGRKDMRAMQRLNSKLDQVTGYINSPAEVVLCFYNGQGVPTAVADLSAAPAVAGATADGDGSDLMEDGELQDDELQDEDLPDGELQEPAASV
ncbi:hypothetical protein OEZ85_012758 [Tetradesmus obliquus]|uniref:Uncharacterized protein n=1 Tax=Tetradesmus obliquus TaxID=3088 RepID=A0ABY8U6H5_TETOB|nr:hypothetical protein OEZ85_012758 [Tetradesmus obliquus]